MARSWQLTGPAVADMQRIMGSCHTEARAQLQAYVEDVQARSKPPRETDGGLIWYRTGKPHRCRLVCEPGPPVRVIRVLPDHELRTGSYQRSSCGLASKRKRDGAREREDERWLRLADLEQLDASALRAAIEADPAAVERVLQYLDDRGEISDRQWEAGQLSSDLLAKVAGSLDGSIWRKWVRGEQEFGLATRRAIIWAAWGEPVK